MKNLSIIAAALIATSAFAGAPAYDYDNDAGAVGINSTLTRAEVKADAVRSASAKSTGEEYVVVTTAQGQQRDRGIVHAEAVQAARDTLSLN